MNKKVLFFVFVVFAMIMASCGTPTTSAPVATDAPAVAATEVPAAVATEAPAAVATEAPAAVAGAPAACATDEFGCAVIPAGSTVKIGMGAPMTGDYSSFGVDISQGASIAVKDAGDVEGFAFELVAEDDQGAPEGGAAVANKLVTDPTLS